MAEPEQSCEPQVTNRGSRHTKLWESKLRLQTWQGLIAGGKRNYCRKGKMQSLHEGQFTAVLFWTKLFSCLESVLWFWLRKRLTTLVMAPGSQKLGCLSFTWASSKYLKCLKRPGPQEVWGDPRGGLGSSLPSPLHPVPTSCWDGDRVVSFSRKPSGRLFLYHPYYMLM